MVETTNEQVVTISGRGLGSGTEEILRVADQLGYTAAASGPGSFRLARSCRPKWATIAAIATCPLLGLGLLFLLVKTTESGVATVFEDREGTKVRLVGLNAAEWTSALTGAAVGTGAAPASHETWAPDGARAPVAVQSAPNTSAPGAMVTADPFFSVQLPSQPVAPKPAPHVPAPHLSRSPAPPTVAFAPMPKPAPTVAPTSAPTAPPPPPSPPGSSVEDLNRTIVFAADDADGRTIARSSLPARPAPAGPALAAPVAAAEPTPSVETSTLSASATAADSARPTGEPAAVANLVLRDGYVIPVQQGVVLGRNPDADPGLTSASLLSLVHPTLSKTHATVGPSPSGGVWITDHHSTNGTTVTIDGRVIEVPPGKRVVAPIGSQLKLGEFIIEVQAA